MSAQLSRPPLSSADESPIRRRRGRRLLLGVIAALVVLFMGVPLALYFSYQARGRALLREQLANVEQRNEPLTTDALQARYQLPPDATDLTVEWQAALEPFEGPKFYQAFRLLPIINGDPAPSIDRPWPAPQLTQQFMQTHGVDLTRLRELAKQPGEVRFPRKFLHGINITLPEIDQARNAQRALGVEFQQLLRGGETELAIDSLRAQLKLSEIFALEPFMLMLLVRRAMDVATMKDIRLLAAHAPLTDQQLAELQTMVRRSEAEGQLRSSLLGERVLVYHVFYHSLSNNGASYDKAAALTEHTTTNIAGILQPEDCATSLRMINAMVEAADKPLPEAVAGLDDVQAELAVLDDGSRVSQLRYVRTLENVDNIVVNAKPAATWAAHRDATDALLAMQRYKLKHGRAPAQLADLVPEFLPRVPLDPFDGQPLRVIQTGNVVRIYSIGEDRADDGGESDGNTPDVAVEMQLR